MILRADRLQSGDVLAAGDTSVYKRVVHRDGFVTVWLIHAMFDRPSKRFYRADVMFDVSRNAKEARCTPTAL